MLSRVSTSGLAQTLWEKLYHRLRSSLFVQRDVPTITTLPLEILIQVLQELDFLDVLRVRQTCKLLCRATTARPIWIDLFEECERSTPGLIKLEKPLDLYSSEELERVVIVAKSTEMGWRGRDDTPSRRRHIEDIEVYQDVYLVPGGRWLLVFHFTGEISYHDLDSADYRKKRILVAGDVRLARCNMTFFAVDVSNRTPWQNFKLAQYVAEDPFHLEGDIYRAVRIWDIAFVIEGQTVTGLRATRLKTILVDPDVVDSHISLSLRDEHLLYAVSPEDERGFEARVQYICVVEWMLIEDGSLDYPRKLIKTDKEADEMYILPNNRVSVYWRRRLLVYDYSAAECTDHLPKALDDDVELTPPAECPLLPCGLHTVISAPFEAQDGTVCFLGFSSNAICENESAQSISIPYDFGTPGASSPEISKKLLIPLPPHDYCDTWSARYMFGRRRGILYKTIPRTDYTQLILLEYDLEQEFTPDYLPVIKVSTFQRYMSEGQGQETQDWSSYETPFRNPHLDEGSGRLVVPLETRFEIFDFALVHKGGLMSQDASTVNSPSGLYSSP
ncbi:hypothetical protein D9613_000052 [Agrocybe pediades]|uniref:F-box domain-containing protein n=1 Tax=Agrocybe pediades TaxID=84607 RepID=A0A8H4R2Z1_9AGAR|nr:hypothetical protein D9613_000052 [Agrocybe pediades]